MPDEEEKTSEETADVPDVPDVTEDAAEGEVGTDLDKYTR